MDERPFAASAGMESSARGSCQFRSDSHDGSPKLPLHAATVLVGLMEVIRLI